MGGGKLGIIDWGIGGVSVYKSVKQSLGDMSVTYFSDTGVTAYGKMTRAELVSRLNAVIEFLQTKGVTHIILGCNAASTAIDFLEPHGVKIEGMIESGVSAALKMKPARLGLIGGRRTVLSGAYRRAFMERGIGIEQRIAQPLSGLIESGDTGSTKLRNEAEKILYPIRNCSHILMACTHYPAIQGTLKEFISKETTFVDPVSALVNRIKKWKLLPGGKDTFLTSGDPANMKKAALNAFGVAIQGVRQIKII
jgi:glutamate racemase